MAESTDKSKTNKKWVSTDEYKEGYERIFGKEKAKVPDEDTDK